MSRRTLKQRLADHEIVRVMSMGAFPSHKIIEAAGLEGNIHGVWIDQEHARVSHAQMEILLLACRAAGLDAFARVAPTDYAAVMRPLETGCSGVMIAQVRTLDEVRQAVQWSLYPPAGVRGLFLGNAESSYGRVTPADQVRAGNENRWLVIQIETAEAVALAAEIAAIDGVDHLFVGPGDLAANLGVPGQPLHEKCLESLRRVNTACEASGKSWGTLCRTADHAAAAKDLGCRLFSIYSDMDIVNRGLAASASIFREIV